MLDVIKAINPFLGSAIVLAVLWIAFRVVTGSFRVWRVAVGVDGRWSSSRFQGLLWLVVVVFSYLAMFIARVHVGSTEPLTTIPQNVLTALGLSMGTTAAAAGITSSRVARNKEVKPRAGAAEHGLAALVEDDQGRPDLTKTQLVLWAIVTLAIYLVATADAVAATLATTDPALLPNLPDIDPTLLILSGIGQGSYLVTKASTTTGVPTTLPVTDKPVSTTATVATTAVASTASATAARAAATVPTSVRVPGFTPSVNGLRFANDFPPEAMITFELPGIGTIPIGDPSNGLCGGMVFTARDAFETAGLAPIAVETHPTPDQPLFKYIVERLIASFDVPGLGFLKYYDWMITPDGDAGWPPLITRRGVAWKTIVEEWPGRIRPDLDAGRLCCLGLVTVASADPAELGQNHQVLAYGYDLDASGNLRVLVYDPNTSRDAANEAFISLSLTNPEKSTLITSNIRIAHTVRGFFRVDYAYRDPTGQIA